MSDDISRRLDPSLGGGQTGLFSDAEALDLAGALVASRYEVRARIGAGGMGAVYRALDRNRGKEIALKVMLPSLLARPRAIERFRHEAELMLGFSHPGIVKVLDVGEDPAREIRYYTMELLEGHTLRALIDKKKGMDPALAVEIARQLLEALRYAHDVTVHRDLKPENVYVLPPAARGGPPRVKVLDFGIAKLLDVTQLTQRSVAIGTAFYMAPEQQDDAATVDARADLYALSVVLYEMLVGRRPTGVFRPPSAERPGLPAALDALILKGLESDVERRPSSAAAYLRDLEAIRPLLGPLPATAARPAEPPLAPSVASPPPRSPLPARAGGCPACGATNAEDARYCEGCGAALFADCPKCGKEIRAGAAHCKHCGVRVQEFREEQRRRAEEEARQKAEEEERRRCEEAERREREEREAPRPVEKKAPSRAGLLGCLSIPALGLIWGVWVIWSVATHSTAKRDPVDSGGNEGVAEAPIARETSVPKVASPPPPPPDLPPPPAPAVATGWFGERLPKGLRKGREKPVYVWDTGKGLEIEMVYVPPGDFLMGAHDGDAYDDEKPRHTHPMPEGYWIGRYETTWREYRAFCKAMGRAEPSAPGWGAKDDHPVVNVSWDDAKAFCDWAGLWLPSEAEWEKAARGTDGWKYPWGNEEADKDRLNFSDSGLGRTAAVGSYPRGASPYGALDLAGNVWEWCEDWYDSKAYARYAREDTAPRGAGEVRVTRGGSWWSTARLCRASSRDRLVPGDRFGILGFRPLRSSP